MERASKISLNPTYFTRVIRKQGSIVKKNGIIKNILPLLLPNRKYTRNPFITLPTNFQIRFLEIHRYPTVSKNLSLSSHLHAQSNNNRIRRGLGLTLLPKASSFLGKGTRDHRDPFAHRSVEASNRWREEVGREGEGGGAA